MADLACLVGVLGSGGDAESAADASSPAAAPAALARTLAALESEGELHARRRLVAALSLGIKAAVAETVAAEIDARSCPRLT